MSNKNNPKGLTIEDVVLIVKMSDGSIRQVLISKETEDVILETVLTLEGKIRVTGTALTGIVMDKP